jgi:outer membrane lipoprotein-sorting protein
MTSSSGNSTSKYWIKMGTPTMFKMESTAGGLTSDTIFNGTQYYLYTPSTNTAIAMTVPPPKPGDANSTTQYNPVYIGSKTVNGYACAGYQYTTSGVQTTMWVSTQYGVTVEMTSSSGTIDYSNFNFAALPDSTFQLPAGCIIMTIPGM